MKSILFITLIILFSENSIAQYVKKENKQSILNNSKEYNTPIAGFASYFLPGLGQIYCDENKRGFNFMKGYGGSIIIVIAGGTILYSSSPKSKSENLGIGLLVGGVLSAFTIQIWSTIDAVHLAKAKNYSKFSMKIKPYLHSKDNEALGLTCAIIF